MELTNITYKGHVGLENCEDEPIHIPGSIQPHGYLIAFDENQIVKFCSQNCTDFGWIIKNFLEQPLSKTFSQEQLIIINQTLSEKQDYTSGSAYKLKLNETDYDLLIHETGEFTVIEFIRSDTDNIDFALLNARTFRFSRDLAQAESLSDLCQKVAKNVKEIIGYDRVMIYKFDEEYNGLVYAEALSGEHEPYLGLNYPHTDIPPQARELYLKNLVRTVADTHYVPVPILTRQPDSKHGSLNLSMSVLRSVSPIHIQYLRNMGVRATFTISIVTDGKLWGMVSCHHYSPKAVSFDDRTSALLQATLLGSQVKVVSNNDEFREKQVLETHLESFEDAITNAQLDSKVKPGDAVLKMLNADAFSLVSNVLPVEKSTGDYQNDVLNLLRIMNEEDADFFVSNNINRDLGYTGNTKIAGLLYYRLGDGTQVIWLRKEIKEEVLWAGNPNKAVTKEEGKLSPRLSFAAWTETKKHFSREWSNNELEIAKRSIFSIQNRLANLTSQVVQIEQDQMMNQLVKTNAELENILWIASHDLKEPIRKIRMFISLIEGEEAVTINEKMAKIMTRITSSAERMHELLDDLLLLNRSRRLQTSNQSVNLSEIFEEVQRVYHDYDFELNVASDFPGLKGKALLLKQLFTNIIDNSVKFAHPDRLLEVNVTFTEKENFLQIVIADNGVGFDMEYAELVFQVFKRVNDDSSIKGTGVGLSVCKKIVESMEGKIYAKSKKNEGTRIFVELPNK